MTIKPLPDFPGKDQLTRRQLEVVRFTVHAFTPRETAALLDISKKTVDQYLAQIRAKLFPDLKHAHMGVKLTRHVYGLDEVDRQL